MNVLEHILGAQLPVWLVLMLVLCAAACGDYSGRQTAQADTNQGMPVWLIVLLLLSMFVCGTMFGATRQ